MFQFDAGHRGLETGYYTVTASSSAPSWIDSGSITAVLLDVVIHDRLLLVGNTSVKLGGFGVGLSSAYAGSISSW